MRCCRQKLLQKMHQLQEPFCVIYKISLLPANYNGHDTMQLFVNDIDIGFIPQDRMNLMGNFIPSSVDCVVRYSPRGRPHYDCILSGFIKER